MSKLELTYSYFQLVAVPSPPTAPLEIRTVGSNIVMTSWGTPEWDGGAPLLGYNIAIRDVTKTMWMEVGKVDAHTLKFNIKDLSDNHTYMIRIYARNEIGISEPLESDEPFKVIPGEGKLYVKYRCIKKILGTLKYRSTAVTKREK